MTQAYEGVGEISSDVIQEGQRHLSKPFPRLTLCNVLREIDQRQTDPRIHDLLCLAIVMAKKMNAKLQEYKAQEIALKKPANPESQHD